MQATKLLALSLAIILSPRVAMTDVVGPLGHSRVAATASATVAGHGHQAAGQTGTKAASTDSAGRHSALAWVRSSTPKIKARWGSPRRLTPLRRAASKIVDLASCQPTGGPLTWLSTRSCSNCSGVSGRAKR